VGGPLHALAALLLERSSSTHCRGGWVGPRAGMNEYEEEKICCPHQGSSPGPSSL